MKDFNKVYAENAGSTTLLQCETYILITSYEYPASNNKFGVLGRK